MCNTIENEIECAVVYKSPSQTHMIGVVYEDKNTIEHETIKYPNSFDNIILTNPYALA